MYEKKKYEKMFSCMSGKRLKLDYIFWRTVVFTPFL